jgi:hypothetical protein
MAFSHISHGFEQRNSPDFPHLITSISSPGFANRRAFISACIELVTEPPLKVLKQSGCPFGEFERITIGFFFLHTIAAR